MKIIGTRPVYEGHFRVSEVSVQDGDQTLKRERFERGDSVAALVHDPATDTYLLAEQWRVGAGDELLELPAGSLDHPGEDAQDAMRRELLEELGCEVGELTEIATFYPSPGACTEQITLYFGQVTRRTGAGGGNPEEGEKIRVVELSWDELRTRPLRDGKTLLAVAWEGNRR